MNRRKRNILISTILTACCGITGTVFLKYGEMLCRNRHPEDIMPMGWNELYKEWDILIPLFLCAIWITILFFLESFYIVHRVPMTACMVIVNSVIATITLKWTTDRCSTEHFENIGKEIESIFLLGGILLFAISMIAIAVITYYTMTKLYFNYWNRERR